MQKISKRQISREKRAVKLNRAITVLAHLRIKHPERHYKISRNNAVVRQNLNGNGWAGVCIHNKQPSLCIESECEGGGAICKHGIKRTRCKDDTCGGGGCYCIHQIERTLCRIPECNGGGSYCVHGKLKRLCPVNGCGGTGLCQKHGRPKPVCPDPECGGGTSLCKHGIAKTFCRDKECGGGGAYCKHDVQRSICSDPDCGGGGSLCKHLILRVRCPDINCGGGSDLCTICRKTRKLTSKETCTKCDPYYVEYKKGYSKISCKCIDALEVELGISIQHAHYTNEKLTGSEYRPDKWKKKAVDGYYRIGEEKIIIEFMGDVYHGHPRLWQHNAIATDRWGRLYKDLYDNTHVKLQKLKALGYTVYYIWEYDYTRRKALQSVKSLLIQV